MSRLSLFEKHKLIVLLLLLSLSFCLTCSQDKLTSFEKGSSNIILNITIKNQGQGRIGLKPLQKPSFIAKVIVTITASDMKTITKELETSDWITFTGTVEVPKGDNRTFTVEAIDDYDIIRYKGSTTQDIKKDTETVFVELELIKGAIINDIWVDFNVVRLDDYNELKKGMIIHIIFNIVGYKGTTGRAVCWFYYADTDVPLSDFNGRYQTIDGKVAVGKDFTPAYDNTIFTDFEMFMPYPELHMAVGTYNLKFKTGLFDNTSEMIAYEDADPDQYFTFIQTSTNYADAGVVTQN
ncbi:MAG: hypothetical protein ONB05_01695 [candidate division KSB1 bacterium]|nr:hypothetical protein [candidate division KSB1 bacterium]